ncbi:MAG: DUF3108 domain-containing protein [Alphaproteobacteria bacterium]
MAIAIAAGLCGPASALASEGPVRLSATYEITLAGLPAATEEIEAVFEKDAYDIRANTRTVGALDLLVHFRSAARTQGAFVGGEPRPASHDAENRWRGKDRHVHLKYLTRGIEADVAPTAEKDDRDPVPEGMIPGAFDPITAALRLMRGAESVPAPCVLNVPVFDGRRRYDLASSDGGLQVLKGSPRPDARVCRVTLVSLAGRSRNPFWPRRKEPRGAEIWFESLDPRLPPLAVLVKAQAGLAPLRARLIAATIDGRPLPLQDEAS